MGASTSAETSQDQQGLTHQLQLGPHITASYNLEEPFLDLTKSMSNDWTIYFQNGDVIDAAEARVRGHIDSHTGLPVSLPDNAMNAGGGQVLNGALFMPEYFADDYILDWEGAGYGFIQGQPRNLQSRKGKNEVRFVVGQKDNTHRQIRFSRLRDGGVKKVRLYREKYRNLIDQGEIWNPVFLDYVKKYDVVRTMDLQAVNALPVRSFSEIALPNEATYANKFSPQWPAPARYGIAFEVLFDLADKSGVKLWMHVPPMLGASFHLGDPSLRVKDNQNRVNHELVRSRARDNAAQILASPEWEKFAVAFVDRLEASNYPAEKLLYIELGNEIWNIAYPFALHSYYAWGIGEALNPNWGIRQGYGVLSARAAAAIEIELKKRALNYNIQYVLASQTATPVTTSLAIDGWRHQLNKTADIADAVKEKTGIALTTYSYCSGMFSKTEFGRLNNDPMVAAWEDAIKSDPEGLKIRLHDYCINGPANAGSTRNWVVDFWRRHANIAEKSGLKLIGAYEGGSHDFPHNIMRQSDLFKEWWTEFHWGPYGADVIRQINLSLIEEFPGIMLSNYASMGEIGGPPWIDGHYSRETDMLRMWDEFAKPE